MVIKILQLALGCFFVLSFTTFLQNLFLISEEYQEPLKDSNGLIRTMFGISILYSILEICKQFM